MDIAIVGCGIGGYNIMKTIMEHDAYRRNDDIYITRFDKFDRLGLGIAYDDRDTDYKLLNVHEEYMTLDMGNPHHIFDWLDKNPDKDYKIEGMLPRTMYGKYILDSYSEYDRNINIFHCIHEVVDIKKKGDKYIIVTDEKTEETRDPFDVVFLAIGQSYYKDAYGLDGARNFVRDPYPLMGKLNPDINLDLSPIDKDTTIGIIGAGPTSIDIYRYLRNTYEIENPIYFFTKSSGFNPVEIPYEIDKKVCSIDDKWIDKNKNKEGFISLEKIKKTIEKDFETFGHKSITEVYEDYKDTSIEDYKKALYNDDNDLGFAQIYCMDLWNVAARLYNSLSGLDRLDVDQNYLKKVDFIVTKTPTETMKKLIGHYDSGKLQIIRDTTDIKTDEDEKFIVTSENNPEVKTDIIINAQGFETNLLEAIKEDRLLRNLYDKDFIEPDVNGKYIRVTYPSYNLITKKHGVIENMYLEGMWAASTDILNNDIRSILQATELMANDWMDKSFK